MGAPNYRFIPPAILLDQPGLTAEAFSEELAKTRSSYACSCSIDKDWSFYGVEYGRHHEGLFGLAEILGLRISSEGKENLTELSKWGVSFEPSSFQTGNEEQPVMPRVVIRHSLRTTIGQTERLDSFMTYEPVRVGATYAPCDGTPRFVVIGILDSEKLPCRLADAQQTYRSDIRIRRVSDELTESAYDDPTALNQDYPWLSPLSLYEFDSTKAGTFGVSPSSIPWRQEKGRYYLDDQKLIVADPRGSQRNEHIFSSIVLTAEAIRLRAWNLLCYDGGRHTWRFLADFPEARERHSQAILSWHMTKFAHSQAKKLTNTEYLRLSLDAKSVRTATGATSEEDAKHVARCIEAEGFGYGRYLQAYGHERFTGSELESLSQSIARREHGAATAWLREYLERRPKHVAPKVVEVSDELPF